MILAQTIFGLSKNFALSLISVYTAKLAAIALALRHLRVVVLADSRGALKSMATGNSNSRSEEELEIKVLISKIIRRGIDVVLQ